MGNVVEYLKKLLDLTDTEAMLEVVCYIICRI